MYEIVFSPTGGTKKVADLLCGGIAGKCRIVDLCDRKTEQENRTFTAEDVTAISERLLRKNMEAYEVLAK